MNRARQQVEASKYMAEIGTVPMAWGPFAEGKNGIFTNETLVGVGAKYGYFYRKNYVR